MKLTKIFLNGQEREIEAESLLELLHELELPLSHVLVELNGVALFRSELEKADLKAGDRVEILKVVAGG